MQQFVDDDYDDTLPIIDDVDEVDDDEDDVGIAVLERYVNDDQDALCNEIDDEILDVVIVDEDEVEQDDLDVIEQLVVIAIVVEVIDDCDI